MITPESIDLAALPSVALGDRAMLPSAPCIYFCLGESGVIHYIGRSVDLQRRWLQHHRHAELETLVNVRIAWVEVSDLSLLATVETALINHFNPSLNRRRVKIRRSALKKKLGRRVYIDISRWWLKDGNGEPLSVYAVHQKIVGTANEVSRHTLTRARDGLLEKADVSNLKALARLCSEWSGKQITIDDLVVEEDA